ncbi:MAG: hypothetical protein HY376_00360 [Candidatus Blackburnbacteria bacterium]|nr:hypothetical protein [Candidatus Blackburnbacteria bacterium]
MALEILHPEARTAGFFDQDLEALDSQLQGRWVVMIGTGKGFRIVETQPYPKVGKRYVEIADMKPGELWSPPVRGIQQALIVVKGNEPPGACIRILKVECLQPNGDLMLTKGEGELAKYLGLGKGAHYPLTFHNAGNTLYLETFFRMFGKDK